MTNFGFKDGLLGKAKWMPFEEGRQLTNSLERIAERVGGGLLPNRVFPEEKGGFEFMQGIRFVEKGG